MKYLLPLNQKKYIKEIDLSTLDEESMTFHKSNFKKWVLNHINKRYIYAIKIEIANVINSNYFWMEKWTRY